MRGRIFQRAILKPPRTSAWRPALNGRQWQAVAAPSTGKIKGTGIVGIVRGLRAEREAALRVLPLALHHYLEQRVAITAWYPEAEFMQLMEALLRVYKRQSWESAGAASARDALQGVYRNIVVEGEVEQTARRMRVNWRNYHDTGELTVALQPGIVQVTVADYCVVSSDMCRLNQGYFATILELAGAQVSARRKRRCRASGDPLCVWEFPWQLDAPAVVPPKP